MMLETPSIAETFGVKFRVDVERRIEGARKVGAHKTSMLQDLERGRPMEIDPLVTVVQEMGRTHADPDTDDRRSSGADKPARQNRRSLLNASLLNAAPRTGQQYLSSARQLCSRPWGSLL